jgi:transcription elongation factor Elf1
MKAERPRFLTVAWECPDCGEQNSERITMTPHGLTNAHLYLCCADCDSRLKVQVVAWHTPSMRKAGKSQKLVL